MFTGAQTNTKNKVLRKFIRWKEIEMYTSRFFTALVILSLAAVIVLTVQEAIATSAVTSDARVAQRMKRSQEADMARWQGIAEYYQNLADVQPMERSRAADTARWQAMAEYYQGLENAQNLARGRAADAARWTARAEYYMQTVSATR